MTRIFKNLPTETHCRTEYQHFCQQCRRILGSGRGRKHKKVLLSLENHAMITHSPANLHDAEDMVKLKVFQETGIQLNNR
jgi:hypothetical protein